MLERLSLVIPRLLLRPEDVCCGLQSLCAKLRRLKKVRQQVRFVSFNVNGIRASQHQLQAVTIEHQPDILALQETKVVDDDFPLSDCRLSTTRT